MFYDVSLAVKGRMNLSLTVAATASVLLNGVTAACTVYFIFSYVKNRRSAACVAKHRMSILPIALVLMVFAVLSCLMVTRRPYSDGTGYYSAFTNAIDSFSYTYQSWLLDLRMYQHATQGIFLFSGVGQMLAGWYGVYIVQCVLTLLAMFCLYGIFGKIFADLSAVMKALGVALFAFNPYILGMTSHFSPDLYCALFLIFVVFFFLHDLDLLASFSMILLYLTKETGILVAAGFLIWTIIGRIRKLEGGNFISRAMHYLWPEKLVLYLIPELMLLIPGLLKYPGKSLTTGSDSINKFYFSMANISVHSKQSFEYNFFWIYLVLLIISLFIMLARGKKAAKKEPSIFHDADAFGGLLAGFSLFLIFIIFLFVTTPCPRYAQPLAFAYAVFGMAMILYIWKNRKIAIAGLLSISVLFMIQSFFSIDPSMMTNYSINLGKQKVYGPVNFYVAADCNITFLCEMYSYNRLCTFEDSLMEDILRKIDPSPDTIFYACGYDYHEVYNAGEVYWNPTTKQVEAELSKDNFKITIIWIDDYDLISDKPMEFASDFYVIMPARKDKNDLPAALFDNEIITEENKYPYRFEKKGCREKEYFTVDNWAGYLAVYRYGYE